MDDVVLIVGNLNDALYDYLSNRFCVCTGCGHLIHLSELYYYCDHSLSAKNILSVRVFINRTGMCLGYVRK